MSKTSSVGGGFSIFSVLGVIFIVMKLAEIGAVASWSWWLVLSPFWVPFAILAVVGIGAFVVYMLAIMVNGFR